MKIYTKNFYCFFAIDKRDLSWHNDKFRYILVPLESEKKLEGIALFVIINLIHKLSYCRPSAYNMMF